MSDQISVVVTTRDDRSQKYVSSVEAFVRQTLSPIASSIKGNVRVEMGVEKRQCANYGEEPSAATERETGVAHVAFETIPLLKESGRQTTAAAELYEALRYGCQTPTESSESPLTVIGTHDHTVGRRSVEWELRYYKTPQLVAA